MLQRSVISSSAFYLQNHTQLLRVDSSLDTLTATQYAPLAKLKPTKIGVLHRLQHDSLYKARLQRHGAKFLGTRRLIGSARERRLPLPERLLGQSRWKYMAELLRVGHC